MKKLFRKIHYWGALLCALPLLIVIGSGVLLLLKKEFEWIQPQTIKSDVRLPMISFPEILQAVGQVPEVGEVQWSKIDRLDVRPNKGVIKVRMKNNWEVQLNPQTGEVMHVAFRRSDIIESFHDGTFFHDEAKLKVFLPAAITLFVLWITGVYLFIITEMGKYRSRKKRKAVEK